jgi:N-acetylglucosaminyl-diphospho-decaprenol L-rhamnosyltransferase
MAAVDVVVVSYNSAEHLRETVEPLTRIPWVDVIVVDNDSSDGSLGLVSALPLTAIANANTGFSGGNNVGWRAGASPYVLFLNPDARIDTTSLKRLLGALEAQPNVGLVAPKIIDEDGELHYSLRRFPRFTSTFAQALFLHRIARKAQWAEEKVRDPKRYEVSGPQEWVSGAAMLVRRSTLEHIGGWDEGFFLYCEDIDICRRIQNLGLQVVYDPKAVVVHAGGQSAPWSSTLPILAASRLRYARLHRSRAAALGERIGVALEAASHFLVGRGGRAARAGWLQTLGVALRRRTTGAIAEPS